ncbi:MAG: hypothetical protein WBH85_07655 [Thermoanaerobaculia bacterium]
MKPARNPVHEDAVVRAREHAARLHPDLVAASREVDRTLLRWMLGLSPRARLRVSANATGALARFRRVAP